MVTTTTTYSFKKPTVGDDEDVWGGYLNDSMDLIDDVLDGTTPVTGIDINSGTIDNTVIGGTTPVAGTFTALTANTSLGVTGNITVSGTVDGVDIATRDGVLTTTTTTANAALPKAGGTMTGAITFAAGQTFDGRDVSADGAKLDGIESGATADQTKADIDALGIAASTAATLATSRNIALTGAVTGNVNFDGSGNVSIATTATSDPVITLTGAVTGSGTMTNLGNVSIATTATADPTLTLSGDASGSATFTNLGNATLSVTVADDSHNHVISNIDGLQTALDGKASTTGSSSNNFSANTVYLSNLEKSNLATDGQLGFDSSQGLLVYRTQQGITGTTTVLDGANVAAGTGVSITNLGTGGTGTEEFTFSIGQAVGTGNSPTFAGMTLNGTLTLGANVINDVEDIYLRDKLFHDGDTDTYLGFGTNTINLVTGNTQAQLVADGLFLFDASLREDYDALSGTTPTCNPNTGGAFSLTMTGNTTFTFTTVGSGFSTGFVLELTGNGSTVTWPTSVDWAGGTAPDAPASGETDIYVFWTRNGGTTWYGVQSIDAAA